MELMSRIFELEKILEKDFDNIYHAQNGIFTDVERKFLKEIEDELQKLYSLLDEIERTRY